MQPSLPIKQVKLYRPGCPKCGSSMMIATIEPSDKPDHDMRTFECPECGNELSKVVKFR